MAHSLSQIYLHLVFSTKERQPLLRDDAFRHKAHAYLAGVCKNLESPALVVGGVEDHVHILCRLSRELAVADLFRDLKRESSKWIKEQPGGSDTFYWQDG